MSCCVAEVCCLKYIFVICNSLPLTQRVNDEYVARIELSPRVLDCYGTHTPTAYLMT